MQCPALGHSLGVVLHPILAIGISGLYTARSSPRAATPNNCGKLSAASPDLWYPHPGQRLGHILGMDLSSFSAPTTSTVVPALLIDSVIPHDRARSQTRGVSASIPFERSADRPDGIRNANVLYQARVGNAQKKASILFGSMPDLRRASPRCAGRSARQGLYADRPNCVCPLRRWETRCIIFSLMIEDSFTESVTAIYW